MRMISGGKWAPLKLIAIVSLLLGNMGWRERPYHKSPQTKTCDRTGPVGPHLMMLAEGLHGAALHVNTGLLVEVSGSCFIRPVGAVQATTLGPLCDPLLERGGQLFGNPPRLAGGPLHMETGYTPLVIPFEPEDDGAAMDPQISSNLGTFAAATGHQHRLTASAQAAVGRGFEGRF